MADNHARSSLSSSDALFLYLERAGQPVNVASVSIFEGILTLRRCIEFIESKLPLIPRYRQRVVAPVYNIDLPAWEYDPEFDLRNHVREVTLEHGTEAEFKAVAGRVLSTNMVRNRPLWDLTLVHGLADDPTPIGAKSASARVPGNRTGAILRMHHCLVDGIAGVELLGKLLDPAPNPPALPEQAPAPVPSVPAAGEGSLLSGLITSYMSGLKRILAAESEVLAMAKQVVAGPGKQAEPNEAGPTSSAQQAQSPRPSGTLPATGREAIPIVNELQRLLPELATPDRLPFNVVCQGPQQFNYAEIPLPEIKAVKNACEATVNDVVLAMVTSTVRRYAELHKVSLAGRTLRIVVPVNIRPQGEAGEFGNRITFLPVDLPLDVAEPRQMVAAVQAAVARARSAHLPELVGLVGTLLGAIPTAFQALIGPLFSQLPLSLCNLICTNVPGPMVSLYFAGHRLLSCYPYVPIGGEMGMNCAVLTYDDVAYFGFTGDAKAVPDLHRLNKLLKASFAELRKACDVRPQARRNSRPPRSRPARSRTSRSKTRAQANPGSATPGGHEGTTVKKVVTPAEANEEAKPAATVAKTAAVAGAAD